MSITERIDDFGNRRYCIKYDDIIYDLVDHENLEYIVILLCTDIWENEYHRVSKLLVSREKYMIMIRKIKTLQYINSMTMDVANKINILAKKSKNLYGYRYLVSYAQYFLALQYKKIHKYDEMVAFCKDSIQNGFIGCYLILGEHYINLGHNNEGIEYIYEGKHRGCKECNKIYINYISTYLK